MTATQTPRNHLGTEAGSLGQFRARTRAWLDENVPSGWAEEFAHASRKEYANFQRQWIRTAQSGNVAAPHWSPTWGGAGLDLEHQVVLFEELMRADAPLAKNFFVGLNHCYATLTEWGTQEQCERFLPRILRGEDIWCQGFSEPGAGSDLAALRTRAVLEGEEYVVNGQKIWSSYATVADWCLLLVRTDPDAPKRKGITFLLLDLRTPGVEIRPIKQSTGESEFCEIFLTDVRVPVSMRVGEENNGWRIAQSTLTAERGPTLLELAARLGQSMDQLVRKAGTREIVPGCKAIDDLSIREGLADLRTRVTIIQRLCHKVVNDLVRRGGAGPEASIIKVSYSELVQQIAEFGTELAGLPTQELVEQTTTEGSEPGSWMLEYIGSWTWITGGGTNNIQRNVISERVLGLPREPQA
ncbi:acyl-CoA dehydrogenase family protein [Nocardia sp. NPDC005366]|uniref:acyl-CoA dehydrogenase family protein n=1 Tax=Nocardia sp. NPDC005366 TaxID=3156878 RepID=UPI0033BC86EA